MGLEAAKVEAGVLTIGCGLEVQRTAKQVDAEAGTFVLSSMGMTSRLRLSASVAQWSSPIASSLTRPYIWHILRGSRKGDSHHGPIQMRPLLDTAEAS